MVRLVAPSLAILVLTALSGCTNEPQAQSGTVNVALQTSKFVPQEITVKAGSTIRWENKDSYAHDVTDKDKTWNSTGGSGGMMKGAVFTKGFTTPGTFDYYCTLHSSGPNVGMWGRIIVQ